MSVVESGHRDGGPRDRHRLHDAEGRDTTGAPHVDRDVQQLRGDLLRRVLPGDRPPRCARGGAELALYRDLIDLDDDAVQLVLGTLPVVAPVRHVLLDLLEGVQHLGVGGDRQPPPGEHLVGLALAGDVEALAGPDAVDDHPQRTRCGDPWVLLSQRPRGRVARVGEGRLAGLHLAGVQLGELLQRQEDLSAHLHQRRDVDGGGGVVPQVRGTLQPMGDALDGAHVQRDVLTGAAVPACRGPHQDAVLVGEVDGQAVDLQLAQVVQVRGAGGVPGALEPGGQLLGGEDVVEAEHPLGVVHRIEARLEDRRPDLLGGALRGAQAGVLGLELLELAEQGVEVGVADRRAAQVVGEAVLPHPAGEVVPLATDALIGHVRGVLCRVRAVGGGGHVGGVLRRGAGLGALRTHGHILPQGTDNHGSAP